MIGARVKLLSWETSRPRPEPVTTRGITRYHPESTLGTSGMMAAMPTVDRAKPASTMLAGRRLPALRPASMAMANMDSESGASVRPACMALYSSVICKKSGRAIMAPPRVICWSICWETPMRKFKCLKRSGSNKVGFPLPLAPDQPEGQRSEGYGSDAHEQSDVLAALLPDEDAEDDATHSDH